MTKRIGSNIEMSEGLQTVRINERLLGDCTVDVRYHHFVR